MAETVRLICEAEEPIRLDQYLTKCLQGYSRSRLQNLIKGGVVTVDGVVITKTGRMLESGMTVVVELPPLKPSALEPENIPLDIIFENSDLIVINKPAGMVVHPSAGHTTGTLVNAVLSHAPDIQGIGGEIRPGVVHRLDKDTSGLILMAKNDQAHHYLQEQFRSREVKKVYLALVDGAPPTESGVVNAAIGRDNHNRKRMAIVPPHRGREAITEYHTIEAFSEYTLLEAYPQTGRTHQIRVHLAFIGCPIVGDMVYGRKRRSAKIKRHFLHAARITIRIPGEEAPRTFSAPLPKNLANLVEDLRRKA